MNQTPTKPLFQRIDCIRISVPDLEAGLIFYSDQLGHELIWRTEESIGLRLSDSNTEIVLHREPKTVEVDIKVASADQAAKRVELAGGKILAGPFDILIGRCAVVEDPWGNELVLLDSSKGLLKTDADGTVISNIDP
jgi:predicted enzyme related to lactoylglutathione lyase